MSDNSNKPEGPAAANPAAGPGGRTDQDTGSQALSNALKTSFGFLKLIMILLVVTYFLSGLFVVGTDEVKIRLTFGAPATRAGREVVFDSESGWHIKWPWQEVLTVSTTERKLRMHRDFWLKSKPGATGAEEAPPPEPPAGGPDQPGGGLDPTNDFYLMTGDTNVVHLKLTAKYRVDKTTAADFALHVKDPEAQFREVVQASGVHVVAGMTVDDVRFKRKQELIAGIGSQIEARLKAFQDRTGRTMGVRLAGLTLDDLIVPQMVKASFDQADAAMSEYFLKIRQAEARQLEIERNAEGEAVKVLTEAQSAMTRMVAAARSDEKRIKELSADYTRFPDTFRTNYFHEQVRELLKYSRQLWVLHSTEPGARREIRLLLNPRPVTERKDRPPAGHEGH